MKTLILVTGQHRSGTSATAGCLQRLGVNLGGHLMPPAHDNPKGFFEDTRVVGIHDELLEALGASWDRPYDVPETWQQHAAPAVVLRLLVTIVQEFAAESDLFAIKDPRASLFIPLWQEVCKRAQVRLVVLVPQRLLKAVAQSLVTREAWPPERAWLMVRGYSGALNWLLRNEMPWTSLTFPDGLWQASTWARIAEELGVELDVKHNMGEVHSFLDFGLVHHG